MYYNVAQLLMEPTGSTWTYKFQEPVPIEDGATIALAKGQVSLQRIGKGIWAKVDLDLGVPASCSRCLKKLQHPMRITAEEEYLPTADIISGEPLQLEQGEEDSFIIDQRHVLDLTELLRQYTLANRPLKPLCREDCPGLCPSCGTDISETPCSCREGAGDPRWGPLLNLVGREKP